MNFLIKYKDIFKGLQKVQNMIERKEIKPILSNVLIKANKDKIEIYATNLEVSLRETLSAQVIEEGDIVIDARKSFEIIKEMPEKMIRFKKLENYWVEVSTGDILFNIVGLKPEEFPETNFFDEENFQELNKKLIKEMIDKTIYAASNDETKPNLNGILFQKTTQNGKEVLRLVATNGHRLSMVDKDIKEINTKGYLKPDQIDKGVIFPKRGVVELKRMVDEEGEVKNIYFLYRGNSGFFKKENLVLAVRTIDGEFPNYVQAIPDDTESEAQINTVEFLKTLKRVSVISEEKSKAVNITIFENLLRIYASNPIMGEGKETISINYNGKEVTIGFNAGYLIDSLSAIDSEKVIIKIKDEDSPVILTPSDGQDHICIIMPMEIKK